MLTVKECEQRGGHRFGLPVGRFPIIDMTVDEGFRRAMSGEPCEYKTWELHQCDRCGFQKSEPPGFLRSAVRVSGSNKPITHTRK